jgi:uncharacterized protein
MKQDWKLSRYTAIVDDPDTGDLLLHNSFMGAVARVPHEFIASLSPVLQSHSAELHGPSQYRRRPIERVDAPQGDVAESHARAFEELKSGGFLVLEDLDEKTLVPRALAQEREGHFSIIILPHENCNFRCTYCYETFARDKIAPDVVAGLKAFVAQKVETIRSLSVSWFGGEPLLARDAIDDLSESFIESCRGVGIPYLGSITTNAYLLTSQVLASLLRREVRHFQITLDGPSSTHDQTRKLAGGSGTFQRILDNLQHMRDSRERFSVRIRVNFTNETRLQMDKFFAEVAPIFARDPRFRIAFHPVGSWGGPNDATLDLCDAESAEAARLAFTRTSLALGFRDEIVRERLLSHSNVCYAGKESSIVVGSDGTVYKCTVAFQDPRNQVGRLTKHGELLIDQARWDLWTTMTGKDDRKCGACSFSPTCQSRACPLAAMDKKEPPCPMTSSEYVETVRLASCKG